MSVALLSDHTYNRVIKTLNHLTFHAEHLTIDQDTLRNFSFLHSCKGKNGLEHALKYARAQNYRSYKQAYFETENVEYSKLVYTECAPYANFWQLLKSLECIQYQLATSNTMLDKVTALVRSHCINTTADYNSATWG